MKSEDFAKLLDDLERELLDGAQSVGILGFSRVTLQVVAALSASSLSRAIEAIYCQHPERGDQQSGLPIRPFEALADARHDVLVVAGDEDKEELLITALPHVKGTPKVILSGYEHLTFRDAAFHEEVGGLLVPSLANGYPNSLVHLYQCLRNAARLGLVGTVAEFGMFKGGTTMFLSRVIERLAVNWRVIGFDTFGGFPPRRSILDMYEHPGCVFSDLSAVQRYLSTRNVEIVVGDVVETCHRLDNEDLVLSFIDTDNYTPAKAAVSVVQERTVVGGAIVFDHFTGINRFRYTLGERIAASVLLDDSRYFHLHDTGVFYRQR